MAKQPPDGLGGAIPFYRNKYVECGSSGFTGTLTDASDMTIRTQLTSIDCAMITCEDTYGIASGTDGHVGIHPQMLAFDRGSISSGAVTIVRSTAAAAAGEQKFSYWLVGDIDDTN